MTNQQFDRTLQRFDKDAESGKRHIMKVMKRSGLPDPGVKLADPAALTTT